MSLEPRKCKEGGRPRKKRGNLEVEMHVCGVCGELVGEFKVVPCPEFLTCGGSGYICVACTVLKEKNAAWLKGRRKSKDEYKKPTSAFFLNCDLSHTAHKK